MTSHAEVRERLTGPIASLNTTFTRDGSIDYSGLRNLIDADISGGSQTVLLTAGDSLFTLLTDDEIAEVTRVVVEHTGDRALKVAADGTWWTGKTVDFARYARDVGADVLMVKPPVWGGGCTVETFVQHYTAVAAVMPVMLVTNVFAGITSTGIQVLERLLDEVDNIVAVKDDLRGDFATRMSATVGDKWAVFSGGGKQSHIELAPYGAVGYMSNFVAFKPRVTKEYWAACQRGDWEAAGDLAQQYDWPYMDFISGLPGGFDSGIHGVLELYGIAQRWRRPPYHSLSDEEMEHLRAFFISRGWL
jgi:dihydrodipicolinate synthase/N-acetylneuraminate lyase